MSVIILSIPFLGILLGVAVRTKKPLAIPLAPLVWKLLVNEPVSMDDLEETDLLYAQCLRGIRDIHLNDVNQQNFHEVKPSYRVKLLSFYFNIFFKFQYSCLSSGSSDNSIRVL